MSPQKLMNKKTIIPLTFLLSLIFVLSPVQLLAAEIGLGQEQVFHSSEISAALDVISSAPSTGAATTIEAHGIWRNGCVPEFESVELDSSISAHGTVKIMARAEPINATCGQSETEWRFPVDIQFELPGYYAIELTISSEQLDTAEVYAWKDILVEGGLDFAPQTPQPEDTVTLTVTGVHNDGCIPEYISTEISGGTIVVELMTPDPARWFCGQALTSWSIDVGISALEIGDYVVEIYKSDQDQGVPVARTLYKEKTLSVGVRAANVVDYFIYLPGIVLE